MAELTPFHIAFPVHDLEAARTFYSQALGCGTGREDTTWIDFDLYGHHIVAHLDPGMDATPHVNPVDGDHVPVPHFGVVLRPDAWNALRDRLKATDGIDWVIEPRTRFKGEPGEQSTMFLRDPSGNALEFKAFADLGSLFAK